MDEYISVREFAHKWKCTEKWVRELCKADRIHGAIKKGKQWLIPYDAAKPDDKRITSGNYTKNNVKLPLPVGVSDYIKASTEYYYVDKTLLIKDIIDNSPYITLFTRPRRFGKTLNMDMLKTYFEKTDKDTSVFFRKMNIWQAGERYRSYQGKYPVIYISFKDVKQTSWANAKAYLAMLLHDEFARHKELLDYVDASELSRQSFRRILAGEASETELEKSLGILAQLLDEYHGIAPVIIIDEYDTPIQEGYVYGYYDDIISFMRVFLSNVLKDNKHISYGFLTGILRVGKESLFSGLNNLNVFSVLDNAYSQYFGLTKPEIVTMCRYYGYPEKMEELCSWYDGYRFGETEIFNPWSVLCYFAHGCSPEAYWVSTGANCVIKGFLEKANMEMKQQIYDLAQGKSAVAYVDTSIIYPQLENQDTDALLSFLLIAGYLKLDKKDVGSAGSGIHSLKIPNQELAQVYKKDILTYLKETKLMSSNLVRSVQMAMFTGNGALLERSLKQILLESASYLDVAQESFYQGLLVGLFTLFDICYYVRSNREAGYGRYDIELEPKQEGLPGVIIEIKAMQNKSETELLQVAQEGLEQIYKQPYYTELQARNIKDIVCYGVAFSGKKVAVAM